MAIATFLLFTGLVAFISWRKTRKDDHNSETGYFLAGRSLSWVVIAGSLLLTNLNAEQLIGLNSDAFSHGMIVMAWEVVSAFSMVLMALLFLPIYLKRGIGTIPQLLQERYNQNVRLFASLFYLLFLAVNFLPIFLHLGANALIGLFQYHEVLGVSEQTAAIGTIVALAVIGSAYAIFGGLKAVAVSDTLNGVGLLIGGLLIPYLGLRHIGDGSVAAGWADITSTTAAKLDSTGSAESNIPFETLFTGMILLTSFYWCTNQMIVQRTFGAKSLQEGQKGVLFAAFLKMFAPLLVVLPGIIAFRIFGEDSDPKMAYQSLVREVLPVPLTGFFGAVMFGAVMSSFNSALNSAATLFSLDWYKGVINRDATDAQTVKAGKIFGIIMTVTAVCIAPLYAQAESFFTVMKQIDALFSMPLFAVIAVGLFTKRAPWKGAFVALIIGAGFYATVHWGLKDTLFGSTLHWLHIAGLTFAISAITTIISGLILPKSDPFEFENIEAVDVTPWKLAKPVGLGLTVLMLVIYAYFSRFG